VIFPAVVDKTKWTEPAKIHGRKYRTHMTLGHFFAQYLLTYLTAFGQAQTRFLIRLKLWANADIAIFLFFYGAK
jgi:hypothetical protein